MSNHQRRLTHVDSHSLHPYSQDTDIDWSPDPYSPPSTPHCTPSSPNVIPADSIASDDGSTLILHDVDPLPTVLPCQSALTTVPPRSSQLLNISKSSPFACPSYSISRLPQVYVHFVLVLSCVLSSPLTSGWPFDQPSSFDLHGWHANATLTFCSHVTPPSYSLLDDPTCLDLRE